MGSAFDLLRRGYKRLTSGGSTEQQAIQSGIWVTGINIGDRILQLLKIIILARLLSPKAFGLLGIALLSLAALTRFSQLGFDAALVQHEDENVNVYLNTVWIIKIIRGFVIASIAFVAAPYLAVFFGEPRAEPLIQILGVSPLILGLQNPAVVYFQKNLNFHKEFVYQVGARLTDLVVAVTIASVFRSVWALAIGVLTMNIVKFVLSYSIHEYRPSVEFSVEYGREMFEFGKWILISAILLFLYGQGDDAFVGWFFTATALGFYQLAYRFSNAPATEVTHVISRVAFPAFSKVQDDIERLREGYFRVVQLTSVIAFPMAAGIAAVAPQFVRAALGNQWGPMVPLIQALAVWGGLRAFGANGGAIFKSVGRPDLGVRIQTLKVVVIALTIYPAAEYFGVMGVALAIVGSTFITLPIQLHLILSIIQGKAIDLLRIVLYPLVGSLCMFVAVVELDLLLISEFSVINLILLIIVGAMFYLLFMAVVEKQTGYEFTLLYRALRQAL